MNQTSEHHSRQIAAGADAGPGARTTRPFEKPKDAAETALRLLSYLKSRRLTLVVVLVLMLLSTACMLAGSYFLKPLINDYILPGDFEGLAPRLVILAAIYLVGAAASYGQSRLMIRVAQRTTNILRRDLFAKMQGLAPALLRHPPPRRADEPLHERHRQRADGARAEPDPARLQRPDASLARS